MSFISPEFICLFIFCFLLYHLTRGKSRKTVLLVTSGVFIGYFHWEFLLIALSISLLTYNAGLLLEKVRPKNKSTQTVYWTALACLLLCWTGFRHAESLTGNASLLFPLGLSFYTFQAIAYLTEVYWEETPAERNLPDFLLYMLLFMKFLSGPIERPNDLLPQIKKLHPASYDMMTYGLKLIAIGLIKKLIIADHLAPHIDEIFQAVHTASGAQLIMAALLYPIELYADFSGYTDIAIGCAMLFGLRLSPNFERPFTAQTITDFWRRWHISLSSWVRDYLYLPLTSVTRRLGQTGIAISLIITFVALGIWHGVGWNFVIYGLIQGIVIVWEQNTTSIRKTISRRIGSPLYGLLAAIRTYLIFAFSLIFFKAKNMDDAVYFIRHLSFQTHSNWKEIDLGISDHICIVTGIALLLIGIYEYFMARTDLLRQIEKQPAVVRWSIYYLTAFLILAYGQFGSENFIYLQF